MDVEHKSRSLLIAHWFRSEYRWLRSRVGRDIGCPHGAEDIAAETFARVLTLQDVFGVREPRALLSTIARRLMYEGWRRRDLEQAYRDTLLAQPENVYPSPEDLALVVETLLIVDQLLDGLSANAKVAFLHHQLDGMSYTEIAVHLGVSPSRIQQYMVQAFKRIYHAQGEA
ncbi:sigma-70 family RNA polymerase sigma factor [Pseudomonas putida]